MIGQASPTASPEKAVPKPDIRRMPRRPTAAADATPGSTGAADRSRRVQRDGEQHGHAERHGEQKRRIHADSPDERHSTFDIGVPTIPAPEWHSTSLFGGLGSLCKACLTDKHALL